LWVCGCKRKVEENKKIFGVGFVKFLDESMDKYLPLEKIY